MSDSILPASTLRNLCAVILSVINSRESGFARMLQSDAVIWFQRYQKSYLKRGSISLTRQIGQTEVIDQSA
jgi:hypothetical protein